MNINESQELIKKYAVCLECGNGKVGGNPSQGSLIVEDEIFTRGCQCGWKVIVDRRIKYMTHMTKTTKGKTNGVYEVSIHGQGHKYLPINELKERAGVKRINQTAKIIDWLNSEEGRKWALETPSAKHLL